MGNSANQLDNGTKSHDRVLWVDEVKVFACILVVLGHFLQSMTKAGILPTTNLYLWFDRTIYYFHVQLFFICSGFLYQRYSNVIDIGSWTRNVQHKAYVLGIPYLVFTTATWLLKTVFMHDANNEVGGLVDTLFLHPMAPYWYLYVLFFIFLVTPTFRSNRAAWIGLTLAFIAKVITMTIGGTEIYALSKTLTYAIWFVAGMCIAWFRIQLTRKRVLGVLCAIAFLAGSVVAFRLEITAEPILFPLGILACIAVLLLIAGNENVIDGISVVRLLSRYTMPIYLMHTLCAAPLRVMLTKVGVTSAVPQVIAGILASFAGPILIDVIYRQLRQQLRLHER